MLGEGLEQIVFHTGQRHFVAVAIEQLVGIEIEAQLAEGDVALGGLDREIGPRLTVRTKAASSSCGRAATTGRSRWSSRTDAGC